MRILFFSCFTFCCCLHLFAEYQYNNADYQARKEKFIETGDEQDFVSTLKYIIVYLNKNDISLKVAENEIDFFCKIVNSREDLNKYQLDVLFLNGVINSFKGKGELADHYFHTMREKTFEINEILHGAFLEYNIGIHYYHLGKYDKTIGYLEYSHQQFRNQQKVLDFNAQKQWYAINNALGLTYRNLEEYEKSKESFYRAISITDQEDWPEKFHSALAKGNLAVVYHKIGNHQKAIDLLLEDYDISLESEMYNSAHNAANSVAEIFLEVKKYESAKDYLMKALELSYMSENKKSLNATYSCLINLYEEIQDFESAFYFSKLQTSLLDSLHNVSQEKLTKDALARYQLADTLNEIDRISLENTLKQRTIYLGIAVIALIIIVMFIFFIKNKALQEKRRIIEKQKDHLDKLNHSKDKLFSIIAHDLRSPLISIQILLQLFQEDDVNGESFKAKLSNILKDIRGISFTMDNLLKWAGLQMKGGLGHQPELLNIRELVNESVVFFRTSAELKEIRIENRASDEIFTFSDKNQVQIVLRNLIGNALKFSNPGGSVKISTEIKQGFVHVSVADNGIGMSEDTVKSLFTEPTNTSSYGTEGERGTGLGLNLCKEVLEHNGGKMDIYSFEGAGTTIVFTLPLATSRQKVEEQFVDIEAT